MEVSGEEKREEDKILEESLEMVCQKGFWQGL